MKAILKYMFLATSVLYFSSCSDFLDREPISQITPDNYFNSESNADAAVNGMYRSMLSPYSYGQSLVIIPEFSAGHVTHSSLYPEFINFETNNIRVDNPWTNNMWQAVYATINAANNIIARVPEMDASSISEEKRAQFVGEAKFVRALSYFFLVRAFGGVPMPLSPTEEDTDIALPRAAVEELYNQIITDLQEASDLPNSYEDNATSKGRATGFAVKALLAKVQLYHAATTGDYTEAASLAQEVITNGGFSLVADFSSIWSAENTAESIFELQFDEQATNTLASVANDNASNLFYAKGVSIYKMYEAQDKRRDATLELGSRDRYYMKKFPHGSPASQNFPVMRLAELYLIHAEAQARIDGTVSDAAYQSYKAVRDRAGIETPPASSFASVDAFVTAVQKEKELELMFEGEAWFDFCRTGLALTDMMTVADENYFLYPIPSSQILLNNQLTQNPGY